MADALEKSLVLASPGPLVRVFAEGVLIPVNSVSIQSTINGPTQITIVCPWNPDAKLIKPRTLVHLEVDGIAAAPVEVMGRSDQVNVSGNSVVLNCVDNSSYFGFAKVYYSNAGLNIETGPSPFQVQTTFAGYGKQSNFADLALLTRNQVTKALLSTSRTYPNVGGILGGVLRLYEDLIGVEKPYGHPFIQAAQARLKLLQQLAVTFNDQTAQNLLKITSAQKHIKAAVRKMQNRVDFESILQVVLELIHYVRIPIAFPTYKPPENQSYKTRVKISDGYSGSNTPVGRRIKALNILLAELNKSINPSIGDSYRENYKSMQLAVNNYYNSTTEAVLTSVAAWAQEQQDKSAGPEQGPWFNWKSGTDAERNIKGTRGWSLRINEKSAEYRSTGKISDFNTIFNECIQPLKANVLEALRLYGAKGSGRYKTVEKEAALGSRLPITILFPNIGWFAPPPVCNLLFEDDFVDFSVSDDYMKKPTRLLLVTKPQASIDNLEPFMTTKYTALPVVKTDKQKNITDKARTDHTIVLPHERFTGVLPEYVWAERLKIFKDTHKEQRRTAPTRNSNTGNTTKQITNFARSIRIGNTSKEQPAGDSSNSTKLNENYLEAYGAFEFMYRRLGARTAQVTLGKFVPELAVGFPIAVFKGEEILVGRCAAVMHQLTPQQARTSVAITHVRYLDPDNPMSDADELLGMGVYDENLIEYSKGLKKTTFSCNVRLYKNRSPTGGVEDERLQQSTEKAGVIFDFSVHPRDCFEKGSDTITLERYSKTIQNRVKQLALGKAREVVDIDTFPSYSDSVMVEVSTLVPGGTKKKTTKIGEQQIPFEEVVRPPWLDPNYSNKNIGKIYQDLLGCNSVCDRITVKSTIENQSGFEDIEGATVYDALKSIFVAWRAIRELGGSTTLFAQDIRVRDLCTIEEMLGSSNNPSMVDIGAYRDIDTSKIQFSPVAGVLPFHINAVGLNTESKLPTDLDPRRERLEAVLQYVQSFVSGVQIMTYTGDKTRVVS